MGFPISHASPWMELAAAAITGFTLGLTVLPALAPVRLIGWIGWALAAPFAGIWALMTWLVSGHPVWLLTSNMLGPLGWTVLAVVAADILQATMPLTFSKRMIASIVVAPLVAVGVVAGLSAIPWHMLPWAR